MSRHTSESPPSGGDRRVRTGWAAASGARRAALVAAGVAVLVFLVALGSSRSLDRVGPRLGRPAVSGGSLVMDAVVIVAALVVAGLLVIAWAILRTRREYEGLGEPVPKTWWEELKSMAKLVLVPIVTLLVVAILLARQPFPRARPPNPANGLDPGAAPPPRGNVDYSPHWSLLAALFLLALLAVAASLLARRWRLAAASPALRAPLSPEQEAVRAAVEISLEELEREPDPRRAVVRAYVGMERSLARHGLARRAWETPLEHLARVLGTVDVSRAGAERLIGLFERARFSRHTIAPEMKRQAIAALTAVRAELGSDSR